MIFVEMQKWIFYIKILLKEGVSENIFKDQIVVVFRRTSSVFGNSRKYSNQNINTKNIFRLLYEFSVFRPKSKNSISYHVKEIYTATLCSLKASFNDVLRSVDSFLLPMIKAQGTWNSPAGNFFV